MHKRRNLLLILLVFYFSVDTFSQQMPQFTQYMYNTISVNPAYAGSRDYATITAIGRTQWVGIDGAPDTQTLSYDTPLGTTGLGLGFNFVNDVLGPSKETYLDSNVSYAIKTNDDGKFSFGLRLGGSFLDVDYTRGASQNESDQAFSERGTKFLATVGAGVYYHTPKWYVGFSVPNFIRTELYNSNKVLSIARERLHFFLIGGYVFDVSETIKFKPAALFKGVLGAPSSIDISGNFLFNDTFSAGLGWRWNDSVSALVGFQVSKSLNIGYGYDLTTSNIGRYSGGTHEVLLRYEIKGNTTFRSPRFF